MVGSALCRKLKNLPDVQIITKSRGELDLCDPVATFDFIFKEKPDEIFIAAAMVGGIHANSTYPADFIYQNLQIQNNVIHSAHLNNVQKLLFLGSSCIYPKLAKQPLKEDALLTGELEPTNEPYAIAKIAGIKMCESYNRQYGRDYRAVMPTNLYGPGDNYHPENSHVVPSLIRRFHEAKINNNQEVVIWGTGHPFREFMYVDDMAEACVYLQFLEVKKFPKHSSHINVGTGVDLTIKQLALLIKDTVGYEGKLLFDNTKPDGAPKKLLCVRLLKSLGWSSKTTLANGLQRTYTDFLENRQSR